VRAVTRTGDAGQYLSEGDVVHPKLLFSASGGDAEYNSAWRAVSR
jgi:hypothetical protein